MRLFLAIQLSPAVREALLTAQDALRRQGRGSFPPPENLHQCTARTGCPAAAGAPHARNSRETAHTSRCPAATTAAYSSRVRSISAQAVPISKRTLP